ncbi:unnamed protein product [Alopecurus aequalis]
MSFGSTSGSPLPYRRGLISCLHSLTCRDDDALTDSEPLPTDQDLPEDIYDLIVGFYEEAFKRLPCETMPDLLRILSTAGFCLGLLDPVSNIIVNTIALLPDDDDLAASPPAAKRSKRLSRAALPGSARGGCPWLQVAIRSYYGLVDFLLAYFGCLTMEQAIRYLYWAKADLLLAVMLVQHDLYQDGTEDLDPASKRTQAALEWAADRAGHPSPNTLAQVMAVRLEGGYASTLLKKQIGEGHGHLVSHDIRAINRLLRPPLAAHVTPREEGLLVRVRGSVNNIGGDNTTTSENVSADGSTITTTTITVCRAGERIASQRPIHDMVAKLSSCLTKASGKRHTLKSLCGNACDYLQSLKMYLHGMIHSFYIKAFMVLPTHSGSLIRAMLMAGHCYGSMDPVSNIIINCIWYSRHGCPLMEFERVKSRRRRGLWESERVKMEQYNDIFDPLSLLRLVVCSLEGLTQLVLFADPQCSISLAMEKLCSAKCVSVDMLSSARERSEKNPFHEAAMAAGHPLPLQLAELHQQLLLDPVKRNILLSFLSDMQTIRTVLSIEDVAVVLDKMFSISTPIIFRAPELSLEAFSVVSKKRSQYEARRDVFHTKIEQLLEEYASQHFWEPKYTLDFICGVEEIGRGPYCYNKCYHVNFMATSKLRNVPMSLRDVQKRLFFAEFWHSHEPKPSFCCPLPSPYAGRCYYGVNSARKLAYPDREGYFLCDITEHGTRNVHNMLESDIVYFISEIDVNVAEKLNMYHARDYPVARRPSVLRC